MSAETMHPPNLTWDEFLTLPWETRNAALIDGEVVVNPPNTQHEVVVGNLWILLTSWIRSEVGRGAAVTQQPVKVNDRRGYQPDFAWYPDEQCSAPDEPASVSGLPALIVEVLSPSTRKFDLLRKREDYESIGIAEVWFIDPVSRSVIACQRQDAAAPFVGSELHFGDQLTSSLLDGLRIEVAELFRWR